MTEFENRQGYFTSWDETERQERLNYLLGLIKRYTFSSIAFVVLKRSFDDILSDEAKLLCGDAYGLACIGCWNNLTLRLKQPNIDGYINHVMESGAKGSSALLQIYDEGGKDAQWIKDTRTLSVSFQDKRNLPPLQAADIMAYEVYKHAQRQFGAEQRPPRYPLKQLNMSGRQWHYANEDELRKVNNYLTMLWKKWAG